MSERYARHPGANPRGRGGGRLREQGDPGQDSTIVVGVLWTAGIVPSRPAW
jgi:hypothetical protein